MQPSSTAYLVGSIIAAVGLVATAYVTVDAKHDREAAESREHALAKDLGEKNARIIDLVRALEVAGTGTVSSAECARRLQQAQDTCIPKAIYDAQMLQLQQEYIPRAQCQPQVSASPGSGAPQATAPSQAPPVKAPSGLAQDGLSFSPPSCRTAGGRTRCEFSIVNQDATSRNLALFYNRQDRGAEARSYVITSAGEQIYGIASSLGATMAEEGRFDRVPQQELEPRVPMRASLTFNSAPEAGSSVTLIAIYVLNDGRNRKATFRSVPVIRGD